MENRKNLLTVLCIALLCPFLLQRCINVEVTPMTVGNVVLISPANNATGVDVHTFFEWKAADNALTYMLVIAKNANFSDAKEIDIGDDNDDEDEDNDPDHTLRTALESNTQYYWKVIAYGINTSKSSAVFRFTTAE